MIIYIIIYQKIITNLIIEVPVPPRGLYSINYNYDFNFNEEKEAENNNQTNTSEIMRTATQFITKKELANMEEKIILPLTNTGNNKLLVAETDLSKNRRNTQDEFDDCTFTI